MAATAAVMAGAFGLASPAAALTRTGLVPDRWATTDAENPAAPSLGGTKDSPLGRWTDADGTQHTTRQYYSFDLSKLTGRKVHAAAFAVQVKKATDCAAAAPVEISRTGPIGAAPTWQHPPTVLESLGTVEQPASRCGWVSAELATAAQAALNRGEQRLTIELKVAGDREQEAAAGRLLSYRPGIDVDSNAPPTVSDPELYDSGVCGTAGKPTPIRTTSLWMTAKAADPDLTYTPGGRFAIWPVEHPDQRQQIDAGGYGDGSIRREWYPTGFGDGTVLAFAAQADDRDDVSAWSDPCYVRVDAVAPAKAPVVTSTDYPADRAQHGGTGITGTFRFDAGGDPDVVRYRWRARDGVSHTVEAPAPGAAVTVEYTPTSFVESLSVTAYDEAGNASPTTTYEFSVRNTKPSVTADVGGVGLPSTLHLATSATEATVFAYRIGDGDEQRAAAVQGKADVPVTFTTKGQKSVSVKAFAGDTLLGAGTSTVSVTDAPVVTSNDFTWPKDVVAGRGGTFVLKPRSTHVVAYRVWVDYDEAKEFDAAADGSAVVPWTFEEAGYHQVTIRSVTADGTESDDAYSSVSVIDPRPSVSVSDLTSSPRFDGIGRPLQVNIDTAMPDVTEFHYRFNDGPEIVVPFDWGGAYVTVVPEHAGDNTVRARTKFADGTFSPERVETFSVWDGPLVDSVQYPYSADAGEPGVTGTFTFRPSLPGVVRYTYSFEYGDEQSVDAGPDGTASVELTPHNPGYTVLQVTSHGADGTTSHPRDYTFIVRDNTIDVYSAYDTTRVGIGSPLWLSLSTGVSADLTAYRWSLNGGAEQSIAPSTDGVSTSIQVVPDRNGDNVLTVRGLRKDGTATPDREYTFTVGTAPHVTSEQYPAGQWSGGPGSEGTFHIDGGMPGIVAFEWHVDDEPAVTVAADAGGSATFTWTPQQAYASHELHVRGRTADGTWTDDISYTIYVD
ncbi:hypothetical protein [Actinoplanes sp. N902-109]|uniref:hypothetical protein n=1 Tax=Actinoplanes sp. (strain N902-109) TaxID=649831 RepID=UPI0005A0C7CB|nr:hypothetical protein [Actinoplanes sp. N902-109]